MTEPDYPETVEALHLHMEPTDENHVTLQRSSTGFEASEAIEVVETKTYVPVDELEDIIAQMKEDANNPDNHQMARHSAWGYAKDLERVIEG